MNVRKNQSYLLQKILMKYENGTRVYKMQQWSKSDKKIAKELFELARKRDYANLANAIQIKSKNLTTPLSIWDLRDFLNSKAKEFDQKYDYRYSVLDNVFAGFILEDILTLDEMQRFSKRKQEQIKHILNLFGEIS